MDADILHFDPWGERDATYTVLSNTMVTGRKAHQCAICFGPIAVGERHRAQREADDGKAATFRFCAECCEAMRRRHHAICAEDEMLIEDRYELGRTRAEARRKAGGA